MYGDSMIGQANGSSRMQMRWRLCTRFSPAFSKTPSPERSTANCLLDPRELVDWMLVDGLDARLSLQIHKYIWEPQKKGV